MKTGNDDITGAYATIVGIKSDRGAMIFDIFNFEDYSAEEILKGTRCSNCNYAA